MPPKSRILNYHFSHLGYPVGVQLRRCNGPGFPWWTLFSVQIFTTLSTFRCCTTRTPATRGGHSAIFKLERRTIWPPATRRGQQRQQRHRRTDGGGRECTDCLFLPVSFILKFVQLFPFLSSLPLLFCCLFSHRTRLATRRQTVGADERKGDRKTAVNRVNPGSEKPVNESLQQKLREKVLRKKNINVPSQLLFTLLFLKIIFVSPTLENW